MNYTEISHTIKNIRKAQGLTQAELARIAGVSRITINKFENNKFTGISVLNLIRILDRLGYELEFKEQTDLPTFEDVLEIYSETEPPG